MITKKKNMSLVFEQCIFQGTNSEVLHHFESSTKEAALANQVNRVIKKSGTIF